VIIDLHFSTIIDSNCAEQRRLLAQRAKVCERLAAAGEHHREVAKDASRVMARAALAYRRQLSGERPREAGLVSHLGEQGGAGVGDQALSSAVTSTVNSRPLRCTFKVILLIGLCELQHPQNPASDGRNRAPGNPAFGFFSL
jgi:hypothetical protein